MSLPLGVICGAINQLVKNNCLSQRLRVVLTCAPILAPIPCTVSITTLRRNTRGSMIPSANVLVCAVSQRHSRHRDRVERVVLWFWCEISSRHANIFTSPGANPAHCVVSKHSCKVRGIFGQCERGGSPSACLVFALHRALPRHPPLSLADPCCRNAIASNQQRTTRCLVHPQPRLYHGESAK